MLELIFFIAGQSARSNAALSNLREALDTLDVGTFTLQVVDVLSSPDLAEEHLVLATPTLLKTAPGQSFRVVGDLSDTQALCKQLNLPVPVGDSKEHPE